MWKKPPGGQTGPGAELTGDIRPPVRTVLVDDSPAFLDFLATEVERAPGDLRVAGRYGDGASALAGIDELKPDLVILDLEMPGLHGTEVLRRLKASAEAPRVLVVSLHDDPTYRTACAELGADGYVAKNELLTELAPALEGLSRPPYRPGEEG